MSLAELISLLQLVRGGVYLFGGSYYLFTLLYELTDISRQGRRTFTRKLGVIGLAIGVDSIITGMVGGAITHLATGGSVTPVYVMIAARMVSIVFGLKLVYASWRSWHRHAGLDTEPR